MARVLPQGSRLSADLQVAQGVTQPQSVQGAVTQGEKLSADLQGIMSGGAKIAQTYQETNKTANVNFAQKSADESKVNLYKDLAVLDENTNPDTDLRLKKDAQEALYQHYGNKIFDNEDAQDRFDKQYHNPVSVNIANRGAVLEQEANKQDHDKIVTDTTNNYRLMVDKGETITPETLNSGVDAQTAGGFTTVSESQKAFANEATLGFEDKTANDLPNVLAAAGYKADTGVTDDVVTRVFNNTFTAFGEMQEDGSITWWSHIESEARKEILGKWKSFKTNLSKMEENEINVGLKNYQVAKEASDKQVVNGNTLPAEIEKNNKILAKQASELKNLSTSEKETIYKGIKNGEEQAHKAKQVQISMKATSAQVKGFTEQGVTYTDLEGVEQTASAEYVTNQIKTQQKVYSDGITSNAVGSKEYEKSMSDAIALQNKTGVKNPVVENYVNGITGTGLMGSVDSIDKSIDTASKMRNTGTANSMLKNTAYLAMAQEFQAMHKAGDLTDSEYITRTNKGLENLRLSVFSRIEGTQFRTGWKTAIGKAQDMWFKNTEIDLRTADALLIKFAAEGGSPTATEKDMVNYIKANVVEFAGGWTGFANSLGGFFTDSISDSTSALRMTDSEGEPLEDYVYEDAMENIVKQYNEEHPESKISASDLRAVSPYDAKVGRDQITWNVSLMKDGNAIPMKSYTGDEMIKMAAWKSKASSIDSPAYASKLSLLEQNRALIERRKKNQAIVDANPNGQSMAELEEKQDLDDYNYDTFDEVPEEDINYTKFKIKTPNQDNEKEFTDMISGLENKKTAGGGWSESAQTWKPHESSEGTVVDGVKQAETKTIAYGHKLTATENEQGYIELSDGTRLDFNAGITDEEAKKLFADDWKGHMETASKQFTNEQWDKMDYKLKMLATDINFNTKGGLKGFPTFVKLAKEGKILEALAEIRRKATLTKKVDGKDVEYTRYLDERTNPQIEWALKLEEEEAKRG